MLGFYSRLMSVYRVPGVLRSFHTRLYHLMFSVVLWGVGLIPSSLASSIHPSNNFLQIEDSSVLVTVFMFFYQMRKLKGSHSQKIKSVPKRHYLERGLVKI